MIVEHFNDWQRYDFGPEWKAVMIWLQNAWMQTVSSSTTGQTLDVSAGQQQVAGCSINVIHTTSRLQECCRYEVHRRYCDVQMVLQGQEWLFQRPASELQLDSPFDETSDAGLYAPLPVPEETARLTLRPGMFALIFPWEAHMPAVAVNNVPEPLRKCVAKIPLHALRLG